MSIQVADSPARHRYEVLVDAELAGFAAYRVVGPRRLAFTHTEIEQQHEHQGLGTTLIAEAMKDVERRGIEVLPECHFVRAYLLEHPELDVVPEQERPRFRL